MDEILRALPEGSRVLDLGSAAGSYPRTSTRATTIRFDREAKLQSHTEAVVLGDAARLPFRNCAFQAIISNHSLEHFDELEACLAEIRRVIRRDGSLYVAVPDASTLTDRIYRWLGRGGGHVNPFTSSDALIHQIEAAVGLPHVATRTLCSSLSFMNRRRVKGWPRRLYLLGGGFTWTLWIYIWLSRGLDRLLGTRTSVYGWAFYFGNVAPGVCEQTNPNVCIACGGGAMAADLRHRGLVRRWVGVVPVYRCPQCGATNPYVGGLTV